MAEEMDGRGLTKNVERSDQSDHSDEGDENLVCFASTLGMWDMAGIWSIRGTMLVKIWCSSGADIWHRLMALVTTWGEGEGAGDPGGPYLDLN